MQRVQHWQREITTWLKARNFALYAEPTVVEIGGDCVSQSYCKHSSRKGRPYFKGVTWSQVKIFGPVISPTTFFGSSDQFIPPDKLAQLRTFLNAGSAD